MVAGLYPVLVRTGYPINWKSMLVITWSGLRGAVSLALALVVEQTTDIPNDTIGSKVKKSVFWLFYETESSVITPVAGVGGGGGG